MYPPLGPCVSSSAGRAAARRLQGFAARRADPAGGICASGSCASGSVWVCTSPCSAGRLSSSAAAQRRGGFRGLPPEGRTPRAGSARADPALAEAYGCVLRPFCRPVSYSAGREAARRLQGSSARRADPAGGICASGSCASGKRMGVYFALSAGRCRIPPAAKRRGGFRGFPPEGRTPRAGSARADPALADNAGERIRTSEG